MTQLRYGMAFLLVLGCLNVVHGQGTCDVTYFLTVSESDDVLRTVEASSMTVEDSVSLSLPGTFDLDSVLGLAIDPMTGLYYMLGVGTLPPNPPSAVPYLFFYDPVGLFPSPVGSTLLDFNDLAFMPNGEIRAITNNLSPTGQTPQINFCDLNLLTGGPTDLCQFDDGDCGDSIAIDGGGNLYRGVGGCAFGARIQVPDPAGSTPCDLDTIGNLDPVLVDNPVRTITWWEEEQGFIWVMGDVDRSIYLLGLNGDVTLLGNADHDINGLAVITLQAPCPPSGELFIRGDCNLDLGVNVADAVFLLSSLFVPGATPLGCRDAGDVNDDGGVNVADAVFLLSSLFVPGSAPVPFPNIGDGCGEDPTADGQECLTTGCP